MITMFVLKNSGCIRRGEASPLAPALRSSATPLCGAPLSAFRPATPRLGGSGRLAAYGVKSLRSFGAGAMWFVRGDKVRNPKTPHLIGKAGAKGAPRKARETLSVFLEPGNVVPPKRQ